MVLCRSTVWTISGPVVDRAFVGVMGEDTISETAAPRSPYTSCFGEVHSPHKSNWDLSEAIDGVSSVPRERHVAP